MSRSTLHRLSWQLPALLMLFAALWPDIGTSFARFGPWPLWLLAMPVSVLWLNRTAPVRARIATRHSAQVLVFPRGAVKSTRSAPSLGKAA